jgi:hypothetical protein
MDKVAASQMNNAAEGMDTDLTDLHVVAYDIARGDCRGGYTFEMEGFGPGLSIKYGETFLVSCPFVNNFRGTYGGLRVHATLMLGVQAATFVGPGVCFVYGFNAGIGGGASLGVLRIRHKTDVQETPTAETKANEIPEERKAD